MTPFRAARRRLTMLVSVALVGLAAHGVSADSGSSDHWHGLFAGQVLLIGETHRHAESLTLARAALDKAVARYPCVSLAVEIGSDQQPVLDAVRDGRMSVGAVQIAAPIDYAAYRSFLAEVLAQAKREPCLRIMAIDLPDEISGDRDAWMAARVAEEVQSGRYVVGLFGSLHAMRGIRYRSRPQDRNLADRLVAAGIDTKVVAQVWSLDCESSLSGPNAAQARLSVDDIRRTIAGTVDEHSRPVDAVQQWCGRGAAASR